MGKIITVFLTLFLLGSTAFPSFADELTLKQTQQGEWSLLDSSGQVLGTIKSMDNDAYSLQRSNGVYLGVITKAGDLQSNQRHTLFSPGDAQLYLDALKAITEMKKQPKKSF